VKAAWLIPASGLQQGCNRATGVPRATQSSSSLFYSTWHVGKLYFYVCLVLVTLGFLALLPSASPVIRHPPAPLRINIAPGPTRLAASSPLPCCVLCVCVCRRNSPRRAGSEDGYEGEAGVEEPDWIRHCPECLHQPREREKEREVGRREVRELRCWIVIR